VNISPTGFVLRDVVRAAPHMSRQINFEICRLENDHNHVHINADSRCRRFAAQNTNLDIQTASVTETVTSTETFQSGQSSRAFAYSTN
jgi:REP element-mobilizing transposase RayT